MPSARVSRGRPAGGPRAVLDGRTPTAPGGLRGAVAFPFLGTGRYGDPVARVPHGAGPASCAAFPVAHA